MNVTYLLVDYMKATFAAVVKVAINKLQIKRKERRKIRVFVAKGSSLQVAEGTELFAGPSFSDTLCNDMLLSISYGENYIFANGRQKPCNQEVEAASRLINRPPCWPWPRGSSGALVSKSSVRDQSYLSPNLPNTNPAWMESQYFDAESDMLASRVPTCQFQYNMEEIFPVFPPNIDLRSHVRDCIRACEAFEEKVSKCGRFIAFNYHLKTGGRHQTRTTFPDPNLFLRKPKQRWQAAVRRECRGLILSAQDGRLLARRFHKFFNIRELVESEARNINLHDLPDTIANTKAQAVERGWWLNQKLDGSLVSPLIVETYTGKVCSTKTLLWATKAAVCDPVMSFVSNSNYCEFAMHWIKRGFTPLFEWLSKDITPGVIKAKEDALVLLAIRNNHSGSYLDPIQLDDAASLYKIPLVPMMDIPEISTKEHTSTDMVDVLQAYVLKLNQSIEGGVLQCSNGCMYKLKTFWWVSMAAAARNLGVSSTGTKHGFELLLHMLKLRPTLVGVPQEAVWKLCLGAQLVEQMDDLVSMCSSILQPEKVSQATQLQNFSNALALRVEGILDRLRQWVAQALKQLGSNNDSRGKGNHWMEPARQLALDAGWEFKLVEALFDHAENYIAKRVQKRELILQLNSMVQNQKWDALHGILGIRWDREELRVLVYKCPFSTNSSSNFNGADLCPDLFLNTKLNDDHSQIENTKKTKKTWQVYCGLDGVLADFMKALSEIILPRISKESLQKQKTTNCTCIPDKHNTEGSIIDGTGVLQSVRAYTQKLSYKAKWNLIQSKGNFFKNLDFTPDGEILWHFLNDVLYAPGIVKKLDILTGIPQQQKYGRIVKRQKYKWCSKQLGLPSSRVFTCVLHEKSTKFSKTGAILIDDNNGLRKSWEAGGGIFIHHISAQTTIRKLKSIFFSDLVNHKEAKDTFLQAATRARQACNKLDESGQNGIQFSQSLGFELPSSKVEYVTSQDRSSALRFAQALADASVMALDFKWHSVMGSSNVQNMQPRTASLAQVAILDTATYNKMLHCRSMKDGTFQAFTRLLSNCIFVVDLQQGQYSNIVQLALLSALMRRSVLKVVYGLEKDLMRLVAPLLLSNENVHIPCNFVVSNCKIVSEKGETEYRINAVPDNTSIFCFLQESDHNKQQITHTRWCAPYRLNSMLDLRDVLSTFHSLTTQNMHPSLSTAAASFLGLKVDKSNTSVFDWGIRPLSQTKLNHAAIDAGALLWMFVGLAVFKNGMLDNLPLMEEQLFSVHVPAQSELRRYSNQSEPKTYSKPVSHVSTKHIDPELMLAENKASVRPMAIVDFAGVFLSEKSQILLQEWALPPNMIRSNRDQKRLFRDFFRDPKRFGVHADHITMNFGRSGLADEGLRRLVGQEVKVVVCKADIISDSSIRVLPVRAVQGSAGEDCLRLWKGNGAPHITLWTAPKVRPAHSAVVLSRRCRELPTNTTKEQANLNETEIVTLTGIVGARVTRLTNSECTNPSKVEANTILRSSSLSKKTISMCVDLLATAIPQSKIRFKSDQLNPSERFILHRWADMVGLESCSDGTKSHRRLTISVPKYRKEISSVKHQKQLKDAMWQKKIITDPSLLFSMLGYSFNGNDVKSGSLSKSCELPMDPQNISSELAVRHHSGIFDGELSSVDWVGNHGSPIRYLFQPVCDKKSAKKSTSSLFATKHLQLVVIMRGLPGSGKSTFVGALKERYMSRCASGDFGGAGKFIVCSADQFFEQGAGMLSKRRRKSMTPLEVYHGSYNQALLKKAHSFCQQKFDAAMLQATGNKLSHVIVVDNTNIVYRDFVWYLRKTSSHFMIEVVSMCCKSHLGVDSCHTRCVHGVPKQAIGRMWGRWRNSVRSNQEALQKWASSRKSDSIFPVWQTDLHRPVDESPEEQEQLEAEVSFMNEVLAATSIYIGNK